MAKTGPKARKLAKNKGSKRSERPKRPLSAYNHFFREERKKWLQEISQIKAPVHLAPQQRFSKMGKDIARRWKELGDDERTVYQEMSAKSYQIWKAEIAVHQARKQHADENPGGNDGGKDQTTPNAMDPVSPAPAVPISTPTKQERMCDGSSSSFTLVRNQSLLWGSNGIEQGNMLRQNNCNHMPAIRLASTSVHLPLSSAPTPCLTGLLPHGLLRIQEQRNLLLLNQYQQQELQMKSHINHLANILHSASNSPNMGQLLYTTNKRHPRYR